MEAIPVGVLTPVGILCLVVWMVLTDRLVAGKRLTELREEIRTKDSLIADLTEQNGLMLKSAIPTVNAVLTALHQAAGDDR